MRQYETFELRFRGEKLTDSWADVPVTAVFACGEETKTVKGFYDGDGEYVVRFLPALSISGRIMWLSMKPARGTMQAPRVMGMATTIRLRMMLRVESGLVSAFWGTASRL